MRTAARRFQLGLTCILLLLGGLPMRPEPTARQGIEHVRKVAPVLETTSTPLLEAALTVAPAPALVTQFTPNHSRLYLRLCTLLL